MLRISSLVTVVTVGIMSAQTGHAVGQVTDLRVQHVDNSGGGPALDGFVTNDIVLGFENRYFGSQLLIELEQGSVYQHPAGGVIPPPHSQIIELVLPSLLFDTFVAVGAAHSSGPFGVPFVFGGAVNLGEEPELQFDESGINIVWASENSVIISDESDFLSARVTLSEDAQGTWKYLASSGDVWTVVGVDGEVHTGATPVVYVGRGIVEAGQLRIVSAVVPEPSSLVSGIVVVTALGVCFWRREAALP